MLHVLIADDETHTRISLSFILESAGYLVSDAADGQEALNKILGLQRGSHPVDLLVLDIEMPGLSGWQLLGLLKQQNISLPTIIITGFSDSQTRKKIPNESHVEFIVKPFTPGLLTTSISRLLEKREPFGDRARKEEHS